MNPSGLLDSEPWPMLLGGVSGKNGTWVSKTVQSTLQLPSVSRREVWTNLVPINEPSSWSTAGKETST